MEIRTVTCPACGKSFEINTQIEKVTCNFCGNIFCAKTESAENNEALLDKAIQAITPKLIINPYVIELITKEKYSSAFNEYYAEISKSFDCFAAAYSDYSGDKEQFVKRYAESIYKKIKAVIGKEKFSKLKGLELENLIWVYVSFLIPSVLKYDAEYSENLADMLVLLWNNEHKNRKISKSSFEEINSGFKTKLCFITTAVCETLGRPDNCYELQAFRSFRDNYLKFQQGGPEQIQEYYLIAPMIVRAIDKSPKRKDIYKSIWERYLSKCLSFYEHNEYEQCRKTYTEMVENLRQEWL